MDPQPLPSFSWANGAEVWNTMREKDVAYAKMRNEHMLRRHPSLIEDYRTILFDWLSEVSHECKFYRETYHLALDLIDRYLSAQSNIGKFQLQLIGTTCLFIAAKYEEIRPPTVNEFADLTDGACKTDDIVDNEVVILSALNWDITPVTPNTWLNIYMQILINLDQDPQDEKDAKTKRRERRERLKEINCLASDENSISNDFRLSMTQNDSFIIPTSNGILRYNHKRIASVIDLALLHIESLRFSSSILAASALYHFTSELTVRQCTGYKFQEISDCVHWLEPFVGVIKEIKEPVFMNNCDVEVHATQMHTHVASKKLLDIVNDKILAKRHSLKRKGFCLEDDVWATDSEADSLLASPLKSSTVLLTPPSSTRKSRRLR